MPFLDANIYQSNPIKIEVEHLDHVHLVLGSKID